LNEIRNRIQEIDVDLREYKNKIETINEVLRNAAPTKELQRRRDEINAEIQSLRDSLSSNMTKFLTMFSKRSLPLLVSSLTSPARDRLKEMDVADKGIKGIEAPAILELLKRGTCLCGTQLNEGSLAYKNVQNYINFIPPKNVGTLAVEMIETIDKMEEDAKEFACDFEFFLEFGSAGNNIAIKAYIEHINAEFVVVFYNIKIHFFHFIVVGKGFYCFYGVVSGAVGHYCDFGNMSCAGFHYTADCFV